MRKRTKERAARILGPIEEDEEINEEGEPEIWSESSSTMPNSPATGVVWEGARTGLATECSSEEEENHLEKRQKKVTSDADRKLGLGRMETLLMKKY